MIRSNDGGIVTVNEEYGVIGTEVLRVCYIKLETKENKVSLKLTRSRIIASAPNSNRDRQTKLSLLTTV